MLTDPKSKQDTWTQAIEIISEPGWDRTNDHLIKSQLFMCHSAG